MNARSHQTLQFAACVLLSTLAAAQPSAPPPDPQSLATIEGAVLGAHRLPLSEASVSLFLMSGDVLAPQPPQLPGLTTSNLLGKFSFAGLNPGRYAIVATRDGYNAPPPATLQTHLVTVGPGQHVSDVSIELVPMPVLSGKVTDENGDPMSGVTVRPMRAALAINGHVRITNAGAAAETGPDGAWELTVPSGRTWLSFRAAKSATPSSPAIPGEPEQAYVVTYYPGVRDLSLASPIDAVGGPVPALNVRLRKTPVYHVRGKVTGDLLPDLRIVISQITGNASPSIVDEGHIVKDDGTFDVAGLTPGEWTLNVRQYGKLISMGLRTVRIGDTSVDNFVIPIQQPGSLTISVRTIPKPLSTATTASDTQRQPDLHLKPLDSMLNEAQLNLKGDGTYTLKNLEAGRYRVDVGLLYGGFVQSILFDGRDCIDSGIDLSSAPATATSDQARLQITISMTAGHITGNVTNPNGAPPSAAVVTLVPDGPPSPLYRPDVNPVARTDSGGHFIVNNIVPGTYRAYAWERLDPGILMLNGDPIALADSSLPKQFDNMGVSITIAENESKQLSLPLISATAMDRLR